MEVMQELNAIEKAARTLWQEKWLARLCDKYEDITESKRGTRAPQVRRWFNGESTPNLDSFNVLLKCVNCRMSITQIEVKESKIF
jgi:hypothetical protein